LRITNPRGFEATDTLEGMNEGATAFRSLPNPADYASLRVSHLDASTRDVAYLYAAYARDKATRSADATSFEDAVRQHRIIDQITRTSETFFG
jgi:predicted dehydrogenase